MVDEQKLREVIAECSTIEMRAGRQPIARGERLPGKRFMDAAANPALAQLLMRFSPFVIWAYAIIAIGVAVTGRIPRGKAAIVAAIAWVVGTIPVLLSLARGTPA